MISRSIVPSGQNRGPWVRLYMDGDEEALWPWCAGFTRYIVRQACQTLQVPLPLTLSVSCDSLAASARSAGLFVPGTRGLHLVRLTPGSLFLYRLGDADWSHTGIVLQTRDEILETIEGNTNDDGGREGYEVCHGYRGMKSMDFVVMKLGPSSR